MNELQKIELLNMEIRDSLLRRLPAPGNVATAIPGLHLVRKEDNLAAEQCFENPLLGIVIQGIKHSFIGGREYVYTNNQYIIAGIDLPISSFVENASAANPFLFIYQYMDLKIIHDLTLQIEVEQPGSSADAGIAIGNATADILEMFLRLLNLLDKPAQIAIRGSMMLRELYYLLLIGSSGENLRRLHTAGTQHNQIAKAIQILKKNFSRPVPVEYLAESLHMSKGTFHRYFKRLTGITPLQYQKQLRLYEARRIIFMEKARISEAAFAVGYESVTQFAREYKRFFGATPLRDAKSRGRK